jgi:hypothetical protein
MGDDATAQLLTRGHYTHLRGALLSASSCFVSGHRLSSFGQFCGCDDVRARGVFFIHVLAVGWNGD